MKYLFTILISLFSIISYSQTDSTYWLEKASKIDTTESYILYFNEEITPQVVLFDSKVRILFTMEELAKTNEKLQMIPIMEEVIKKYGIETEIEVGVISSLENQIYVLKEQVGDKEGRIKDLNSKLEQSLKLVEKLEEEVSKRDEIKDEYNIQIKSLEKDLKKQKIKTIAVAIGEGAVIVLLLIVLL